VKKERRLMKESLSKSPTAGLARFITDLRYERIPSEVISYVKICILDTLGCALYGSTLPWGKNVVQFVKECGAWRVWKM